MKKQISIIVTGLLFFCLWLSSFAFAQGQMTRLTIFSNNLGLVEGVKMITLKKGINEVTFGPVSKEIILDSIYAKAEKCEFLEQKYSSDSFLSWEVNSEEEGRALLRVVYLTSGLSWKLNYLLEINKENTFMKIESWATVENKTGMDFFQTPLILTRQLPLSVEESIFPEHLSDLSSPASPSFLPDISYPTYFPHFTLKNKEEKRILLFSKENVPITKVYLFDGEKYGEEVREELWFTNKEEEALPPGLAYIYEIDFIDFNEITTFIGGVHLPEISPQEVGKIYLGSAKNMKGERIQISMSSSESYEDEDGHKIILNEYSYRIILYNKRQVPTTVKVVERFYGELERPLESDPSPYVQGKDFIIYQVEVPPQGKKEIEYTARTKTSR